MSRHRATTRVSMAAIALAAVFALSQQGDIQAGPQPVPVIPESLLPHTLGVGVATDDAVTISFDDAMDRASVEAGLQILPRQDVRLAWDGTSRFLSLHAERRWQTDESYLIVIAADVRRGDGTQLGEAARYSFSTQTAPHITDFEVAFAEPPAHVSEELVAGARAGDARLAFEVARSSPAPLPPSATVDGVSRATTVTIRFNADMDAADVESAFAITPEVPGELTWEGRRLEFTPSQPFEPGNRYTISLVGAHDAIGNVLGGKANFSFVTQASAQVVSVSPGLGETDVTDGTVEIWFSRPMDIEATERAFSLVDTSTGAATAGMLSWNDARTQMTLTPDFALAAGTRYEVRIGDGARDAAGNALTFRWTFTTTAGDPIPQAAPSATTGGPAPAPRPAVPAPSPSSDLMAYALAQINSARAAYGFAPVVLDAGASAAAYGHAYDQAVNNYFSHTSLDGRTRVQRLQAAGVSFSYSGENQCYYAGIGQLATLEWCHSAFMAEPYPGQWNHIANILDPSFHRVGVGIAEVGGRVVITWNFVD